MAIELVYPVEPAGAWKERRLRAADLPVLYEECGERWSVPLAALVREWVGEDLISDPKTQAEARRHAATP